MGKAPCAVERILSVVTLDERELIEEILQDESLSAGLVSEILFEGGYKADRAAVGHFRRKLRVGKAEL